MMTRHIVTWLASVMPTQAGHKWACERDESPHPFTLNTFIICYIVHFTLSFLDKHKFTSTHWYVFNPRLRKNGSYKLQTFKVLNLINISSFKQHRWLLYYIFLIIDKDDWKQLSTDRKYSELPTTTQTHHTFIVNVNCCSTDVRVEETLSPSTDSESQFTTRSADSFYLGTSREYILSSYSFTHHSWAI